MEFLPITRALISVTDKSGIREFAEFLAGHKVELVSTGGTMKFLREAGLKVTSVSEVTGFPEILGGRVKTLHPKIHAGILANKDDASHLAVLADLEIKPFDLVCVNLYNFAGAVEEHLSNEQAVDQIDIGGPCMLRAAAKNYHSVCVVPAVQWYEAAIEEMETNNMRVSLPFRQHMASRTFETTARYDAIISSYLWP